MKVFFYDGTKKVCSKVEFSTDRKYVILDDAFVYEVDEVAGIKE